jgi:hypothetical protein
MDDHPVNANDSAANFLIALSDESNALAIQRKGKTCLQKCSKETLT